MISTTIDTQLGRKPDRKGHIVILDGIDASGKTTQWQMLANYFKERRISTALYSFPMYNTTTGKAIKELLMVRDKTWEQEVKLERLFFQERMDTVHEILNYCDMGLWVLINRHFPSSLAYSSKRVRELAYNLNKQFLNTDFNENVFVLDMQPEESFHRKPQREDMYELNIELLRKARADYTSNCAKYGWHLVNANRPIGEVHSDIVDIIENKVKYHYEQL